MNKSICIILSILLIGAVQSSCMDRTGKKTSSGPDNIAETSQSKNPSENGDLKMEVIEVTVQTHYVSGKIPSFNMEDPFAVPENLGALIRIFVKNQDSENDFRGMVRFNNKSGNDLLSEGIASWCNVPDTRVIGTELSTKVLAGAVDMYVLNIVDSTFYENGIEIYFKDFTSEKSVSYRLDIKASRFGASRILFTSSDGSRKPDGFYVYFENDYEFDVAVEKLTVWPAQSTYRNHRWSKNYIVEDFEWFGKDGIVGAKEINGAYVHLGEINFGETLLEFDISGELGDKKIIYAIKPVVNEYDISLGWAAEYLSGSELFCKTIKYMHFNTVNGGAESFFNNRERAEKYPMKRFDKLANIYNFNNDLVQVHASESFGEPQFENTDPQEIFNFYSKYRLSGYPTSLTLTHEPGFYKFAGLVDYQHFDAYRVFAPHADKWGEYKDYGEKNVRWGAPLETIGDYMRTLHIISKPSPIASWTQGMFGSWARNPNNLEMRIQAYQAIANGALSLYWFNINGSNIINNRGSLSEIQKINREIMVVSHLLSKTTPYYIENKFMDIDLNVLSGPNFAILFAMDLTYEVLEDSDYVSQNPYDYQFISSGIRTEKMSFTVPAYLSDADTVIKIDHTGVKTIESIIENGRVQFTDTIKDTGMYVLYNTKNNDMHSLLKTRYKDIIEKELSYNFDPIRNDSDFESLKTEVEAVS